MNHPVEAFHDREEIAAFLRRDAGLHLYELGDLDDFFWPHTTWYGARDDGRIRDLALLYTGTELPVLLSLGENDDGLRAFLRALAPILPRRLYSHISGDAVDALDGAYRLESHGLYDKMVLARTDALDEHAAADVVAFTESDLPELLSFYRRAYPDNWFDPRMIQTGRYFGVRRDGELVSVAGVHVYSPARRVAALGNIATDPKLRGSGLGKAVTAALCKRLLHDVDLIGLNVSSVNAAAIATYRRLGFARVASYRESMLIAR